jgi:uncharacterized membrane protein YgdD (TMEM256/DUF423 family)
MQPNRWIVVGALLGGLGVALGAYGAHGLSKQLLGFGWEEDLVRERIAIYETAVRYQMFHALALIFVGLLGLHRRTTCLNVAGCLLFVGMLIFSGLLYVLTFAGEQWRWLGAIVPIGGASLIAGWAMLAVAGWRCTSVDSDLAKNRPPADV